MFLFHKNSLVGGCPRTRNDRRTPCPWARSAGAGSHLMAHAGPRGHRQPRPPSRAHLHPVPQLDHPPRGCRAPRPEARTGGTLPLRGSSSCGTRDPKASDSAKRPPNAQNRCESGIPGVGGAWAWTAATESAKAPRSGGSSSLRAGHGQSSRLAVRRGSSRPGRLPRRGYARPWPPRRSSGVGAPRRPPLPRRAGNAGVRGGAAPRQPPQGTHGVWPHGVRWLVCKSPGPTRPWRCVVNRHRQCPRSAAAPLPLPHGRRVVVGHRDRGAVAGCRSESGSSV